MNKKLLLLALVSGTISFVFAQPQDNDKPGFSGIASVQGGLGSTHPWDAQLQLQYKTQKFQINPFFGITGINHASSEIEEETRLTYARPGFSFASSTNLQEEGKLIHYGTNLSYRFNPANAITAAIKVQQDDIKSRGFGHEALTNANAHQTTDMNYLLSGPKQDRTDINATASYVHRFNDPRQQFILSYDYSKLRTEKDQEKQYFDNNNHPEVCLLAISYWEKAEIITHSAKAEWQYALPMHGQVSAGANYYDRDIDSHYSYPIIYIVKEDPTFGAFSHHLQTLSVYSDLRTSLPFPNSKMLPWTVILHMEYDYSKMQDRKLNDFVPRAILITPINKSHVIKATYVRHIIRPELELLNPFHKTDFFTNSYGNPSLEGIHANVASLAYEYRKKDKVEFSATASHIFAKDGFNAIWKFDEMGRREYLWGNEGERTAWSVAPEVTYTPLEILKFHARTTLLWDKRIANAISMEKEHWGITAEASADAKLSHKVSLNLHGLYSEGNTIDLYSHESRNYKFGTAVQYAFSNRCSLHLSFDYRDYGHTIITQGAYTGAIEKSPADRFEAIGKLVVKL